MGHVGNYALRDRLGKRLVDFAEVSAAKGSATKEQFAASARTTRSPSESASVSKPRVVAAGYPGGYSRVRDYVRQVRPREPVEAAARPTTPEQAAEHRCPTLNRTPGTGDFSIGTFGEY